ncbi:hypothetical protein [Microbacterium sp. J1-1]|uniref:hypothetical protein n=1 Tax=Microbacterium sp. J1-1 TaxID=2992441 RepID=UPI002115B689|nr:hypothetical protein [Microbacterium sp. J1-1]UUE19323.1 hypothetical protein LRQ07_10930 [Microbacterium sp. J1-1]
MAKIQLSDGTRIPVVKPNLWDAAAVEKEMGWNRRQYADWMKLSGMQTAFAIFASLRRAGHDVTFQSCADLDDIENMIAEPGDLARAQESEEGEERPDPQVSATPAAAAAIDATPETHPS